MELKPQGTNVKLRLYHCASHLEEGEFTWAEGQAATGAHIADFNLTNNVWTEWTSPASVASLR